MARRARLFASLAATLFFAACGPASQHNPDADPNAPDAHPPCDFSADADADTIADCDDGATDFDGDGQPNDHDADSDGDGYTDSYEAGDTDPMTSPQDTDGDGKPNFLDLDSDNDGLKDEDELVAGTDPTLGDTDGDGFSDLIEVTIHELCVANPTECNGDPNPLDPNSGVSPLDYFFILPYQDPEQRKPLDFATDIGIADVHFSMDTTGSMGGEITALGTSLSTMITQLAAEIPNTAFGVSRYEDYPADNFGSGSDRPFQLHQRVTTSTTAAQAGVAALGTRFGNDTPEAGWEALYRIATGNVLSWTGATPGNVPAFDPNAGYDPATNGLIGGVGFRAGALPIVVQVTDARSHDITALTPACNPGGAGDAYSANVDGKGHAAAAAALQAIGARVIGVASQGETGGCDPRLDLELVATETSARVPPSAWAGSCGAGQCCTGINGSGRPPDGDGLCPLVFDVDSSGGGLGTTIVTGIKTLVNYAVLDISAITDSVPQPNAFGGNTDPKDFITDIIPVTLTPLPSGGVVLDGTGHIFLDVSPGTTATFDVKAVNTILMQATDPQVFTLKIRVLGDGVTVLDTRQVVIIVPPEGTIIE